MPGPNHHSRQAALLDRIQQTGQAKISPAALSRLLRQELSPAHDCTKPLLSRAPSAWLQLSPRPDHQGGPKCVCLSTKEKCRFTSFDWTLDYECYQSFLKGGMPKTVGYNDLDELGYRMVSPFLGNLPMSWKPSLSNVRRMKGQVLAGWFLLESHYS